MFCFTCCAACQREITTSRVFAASSFAWHDGKYVLYVSSMNDREWKELAEVIQHDRTEHEDWKMGYYCSATKDLEGVQHLLYDGPFGTNSKNYYESCDQRQRRTASQELEDTLRDAKYDLESLTRAEPILKESASLSSIPCGLNQFVAETLRRGPVETLDFILRHSDDHDSFYRLKDMFLEDIKRQVAGLQRWSKDRQSSEEPDASLFFANIPNVAFDLLKKYSYPKIYVLARGNERYQGCRWLMEARSPFFEKRSAAAESGMLASDPNNVDMTDIDPETLKWLLRDLEMHPKMRDWSNLRIRDDFQAIIAAADEYRMLDLSVAAEKI
ncbi:uncharacterized protein PV07_12765 [Cladophialophora immunda]|uniref:BTB domain-containing protein n=1 Tax=Cladophialophora immunda TaxID=569365 RepID=A0A0D2BTQ7_9EURO|nr:uncharacterized protein PV07_12765 [Cladophialophora immunda]KIW21810.1 hypothetical protein PV07_12765 [Cladophialophora immunda]